MKSLEIYTDGGCHPNPGFGACAFVVVEAGVTVVHQKAFKKEEATNNIMELSAVIAALHWVQHHHPTARIYINTDSQYVQMGITKWIEGWIKKGWRTSGKKDVKNKELWILLHGLTKKLDVHFQWVKGHAENRFNNLADELCTTMIRKYIGGTDIIK